MQLEDVWIELDNPELRSVSIAAPERSARLTFKTGYDRKPTSWVGLGQFRQGFTLERCRFRDFTLEESGPEHLQADPPPKGQVGLSTMHSYPFCFICLLRSAGRLSSYVLKASEWQAQQVHGSSQQEVKD